MRIEDCEVGMKVRRIKEGTAEVSKGDIYEIKRIGLDTISLKGYCFPYNPKHFEPVNKFKVGDEVINCSNEKIEIWGFRYNKKKKLYRYATIDVYGYEENYWEDELSPLKKPDELEVGDKFKTKYNKWEVIASNYDRGIEGVEYYSRRIDCGDTRIIPAWVIEEIIYD